MNKDATLSLSSSALSQKKAIETITTYEKVSVLPKTLGIG
jgi:hypothetical protein